MSLRFPLSKRVLTGICVSVATAGLLATVSATTAEAGTTSAGSKAALPEHALVGYLHSSFANGSGYTRMADVPDSWDIIDLAFGEPTSTTSGDIRFSLCPQTECSNVESEDEFKAAIKAKQAAARRC